MLHKQSEKIVELDNFLYQSMNKHQKKFMRKSYTVISIRYRLTVLYRRYKYECGNSQCYINIMVSKKNFLQKQR